MCEILGEDPGLTDLDRDAMAFSLEKVDHTIECVLGQLGYSSLKEKQKEVLTVFVSGSDTFVSLPTGYRSLSATVFFLWSLVR